MEFSAQVNAMQHLKEQLEQRTRMIQANIQRQQEELRHIQEQLQRVQGQGIQVRCRIAHGGCEGRGILCVKCCLFIQTLNVGHICSLVPKWDIYLSPPYFSSSLTYLVGDGQKKEGLLIDKL